LAILVVRSGTIAKTAATCALKKWRIMQTSEAVCQSVRRFYDNWMSEQGLPPFGAVAPTTGFSPIR